MHRERGNQTKGRLPKSSGRLFKPFGKGLEGRYEDFAFTCAFCVSVYEVAESSSAPGNPGGPKCVVCGKLLESWQNLRLKA